MKPRLLLPLLLLVPFVATAHPDEFDPDMTVEQTQTVAPMTSLSFADNVLTIFEEDEWLFCDDDDELHHGHGHAYGELDDCDDIEEIDFPFEADDPDGCFFPPCISSEIEPTFFYRNDEAGFCNNCGLECAHTPFVLFRNETDNQTLPGGLFSFVGYYPDTSDGEQGVTLCDRIRLDSEGNHLCSTTQWYEIMDELIETGGLQLFTQSRVRICAFQNFRRFQLFDPSEATIRVVGPGWYHWPRGVDCVDEHCDEFGHYVPQPEPWRPHQNCGLVGLELLLVPLAMRLRRRA